MLIPFLLALCATPLSFRTFVSAYKITGAAGGIDPQTDFVPSRIEINDFATSGPGFDLFLLALQRFQSVNQSDPLSYFQIAGIHGYPSIPWDGVTGRGTSPGYCMHASVAFPLWHRPYLALFEQVLWTHAQSIAATYPVDQRGRYQAAALTLRIPYWDWAVHPALPDVVTTPTIFVNGPSGWHEMENPLYRYDFHPGPEGSEFPAGDERGQARFTTRCSDTQLNSSNEAAATASMLSNAASTLSLTYQLLASATDYSQFSCTIPSPSTPGSNNIESIHNGIHNCIGGEWGTMKWPEYAAFDPVFWLHHAQVDRLVAMWQALNPSNYIVPTPNSDGSYYEPAGTMDSDESELAPFHSDGGSEMFTPETVRYTATLGYTYPELVGFNGSSNVQQANLRTSINRLYNPKTVVTSKEVPKAKFKRTTSFSNAFSRVTLHVAQQLGVNNLEIQWSIRITVDHSACNVSVAIDFFMGDPPTNVSAWSTAINLIGTYSEFALADTAFNYPVGTPGVVSQGEISLTHTLAAGVSRGFLYDLSPGEIVPILQKHLQWRARTQNNKQVYLDELLGLSVSVQSRVTVPGKDMSEFPTYGSYVTHPNATKSKGGSQIGGWHRSCEDSGDGHSNSG